MKNIILFLSLFMFFGCEDVIDIEVPSSESKLIIDAIFEVYHNHTPVTANTVVKLRESANYFDDEIPITTNTATVLLKDLTNDIDIIFEDNNSDGNFVPINPFIPIENVDYELNVFYNEDLYQSQSKLITTTGFSEVYQGNSTLFTGEEIEVNVSFIDDINTENNYLFNFSNDLFLPIQDRFFNGSTYNFSFFFQEDEVEIPSTVLIKMSGVTKEYLTYFNVLISQSGEQAGGPFETIPSSLLGNIVNTTNNENFPLGYFHISETDTYNLSLIELD
jgi:hypothetical protein